MRKIVTSCQYPPIPDRRFDWCAYFDGEEEAGNYGWGRTEAEAVQDFVDNYAEGHAARLDDPSGTYPLKRWWSDATETVAE